MTMLAVKNVHRYFGGFRALRDVSLEVEEGQIHAVIGPNGAGKTTLFNVISGMHPTTGGDIFFQGRRINEVKPYKRVKLGIGRNFQVVRLFGTMSVLENVMLGRHSKTRTGLIGTCFRLSWGEPLEEKETRETAMQWLAFVGLEDKAGQIAANLPHAEQRLVEIARVLAMDPALLLLDEPAAGMDPKETEELVGLIEKINRRNKTILLIEHNMNLIMGISHVISVLNFGEKIAEGTAAEIQDNPQVIEAYLGKRKSR